MIRNHGALLGMNSGDGTRKSPRGDKTVVSISLPGLGVEELTLTRRTDGRHVRIANGRRNRAVGRYASIKTGQSIPWESRLELDDIHRAEVDTTVVSYVAQPETLSWRSSGRHWQYTPDRVERLADGAWQVIEVKDEFDPDANVAYGEKLDVAASIYASLGGSFVIRDKRTIRTEPEYSAIEEIQAYRRAVVTIAHIESVTSALQWGSMGIVQLAELSQLSKPTLCAMMVQRIIHIDLVDGLSRNSLVSLVPEGVLCAV